MVEGSLQECGEVSKRIEGTPGQEHRDTATREAKVLPNGVWNDCWSSEPFLSHHPEDKCWKEGECYREHCDVTRFSDVGGAASNNSGRNKLASSPFWIQETHAMT